MTNDYGNLQLHQVLLAAMKDIDQICRENGLRYYLYAGTLLGAVNYHGFIPWDDDIDLVMFPEDFRCFSEIITNRFADRYDLSTFDTDPCWFSKMNKLLIKGTRVHSQNGEEEHPVFVDICVLHNVPDRRWQRTLQRRKIEFINLVLTAKSGAITPTSFKARLVMGNLAKLDKRIWGKMLDRVMHKYDGRRTEYVGIMCNTLTRNPYTGRTGYDTDLTKQSWHENPRDILFEGVPLMTIGNVEAYLNYQYGPHWAEPYPEEKRVTKHDVKSYEISPEVRERLGL